MAHTDSSEGKTGRTRGRPFLKGNRNGKLEDEILASTGHKSSVGRQTLTTKKESQIVNQEDDGIFLALDNKSLKTMDESVDKKNQLEVIEDPKALELIETLEFKNGKNTLSIRFSKRHNRMFRIQVFLNDECEIRPVTYTGASTGYSFWNLLKGNMKK